MILQEFCNSTSYTAIRLSKTYIEGCTLLSKQMHISTWIYSNFRRYNILFLNGRDFFCWQFDTTQPRGCHGFHCTHHTTHDPNSKVRGQQNTWCRKSNSHNSVFTYLWSDRFVITLNIFLSKTVYTNVKSTAVYYQFNLSYALFIYTSFVSSLHASRWTDNWTLYL